MLYKKTVLDNGITILSEKIKHVGSISIGAWVKAGSRDENAENHGIAHFIEHMLFKGTKSRNKFEIAHFLESRGGMLNAFTSKEYTCFYARALAENLEDSVDIIADIILNSTFDNEEIKKEKGVVLDEIDEILDSPGDLIFDKFYGDLYRDHPLGEPILGSKEDVNKITAEHCRDFIKNQFTPNRIVITASGYLEHDELIKYAEKYFRDVRLGESEQVFTKLPEINKTLNIYQHNSTNQDHYCIGTRTFPFKHKDRLTLLTLNSILSAGMSSRLFQNIREKYGISYSLQSYADFFQDIGDFSVYAATNKKDTDKCIQLIHEELDKLMENPVNETELKTIKALLKSSLVMGLESTTSRMNRLAKLFIYTNEFETIDNVIQQIEKITPKDIQELANRLFVRDNFVTTILKAKE
ncbi:MAG: pitrilysin family protein [Candidatus Cloacimonadota bacterium]|nr:pitrilysin family protein [Candidatus Cloacimonadota bacterium]